MQRTLAFVLMISLLTGMDLSAQDTLPQFSASTRGNQKVLISWVNNYALVKQISIQRSADSTRNFKSILTVPDPKVLQNGFVDAKAPSDSMFYRLFIVLDSGKYFNTVAKRARPDTTSIAAEQKPDKNGADKRIVVSSNLDEKETKEIKENILGTKKEQAKPVPEPERFFFVKRRDSLIAQISQKSFKKFRDSVVSKTRDTLVFNDVDTITIKPFIPKVVFKPSQYVFTEKDGNVMILLPDVASKNYSVKFFEDDESPLFEVKKVKKSSLIVDKANFLHAGWFRFELYENEKLKEKHKFFIPKDF
jgi:hypothetical protein